LTLRKRERLGNGHVPYLAALFKALPHAKTVDDYAALLPWRLMLAADWPHLPTQPAHRLDGLRSCNGPPPR
jgi:hypothetical protein